MMQAADPRQHSHDHPAVLGGGQKTTLTLDQPGGHAITIQTPAGELTQMTYSNGLMTSLVDPRLGVHEYT